MNDSGPPGDDRLTAADARGRLDRMLRQLPGFVYETTARPGDDERFTYLSNDVYLTGHGVEHWYHDPDAWKALVHPDDLEAVLAANRAALESGSPYQMVHRELRVDGSWMWVLDSAQTHVDEAGVRTWTGFCQDVTERFRLERAREVHVRRLLLLLERIQAVVYEVDDTGLAYVSPGRIGGRQADEILAHPSLWREIVHPDDVRRVGARMAAALRGRTEVDVEFRMTRPDGAFGTATNHLVPYAEADGSTTFIGIVLDVTERKRAEQSAKIALHQLTLAVEHAGVLPYEFRGASAHVRSGDTMTPLIVHPDDVADFESTHREAQRAGTPISLEFRYRLERGDAWRWGLARASQVPESSVSEMASEMMPELVLVSGVLIDTTREHALSDRWREIERVLTPRERQAFLLLGRGATNNDIAAALGISHSTATHHVARVLSKLGLPNRAAIAALASGLRLSASLVEHGAAQK